MTNRTTVLRNVALATILLRIISLPMLAPIFVGLKWALGAVLITAVMLVVPVLVVAVSHFVVRKRRFTLHDVALVLQFPIVSNLPGTLELQQKIFGPSPVDQSLWVHCGAAILSVTILLDRSLRTQDKDTASQCLSVGVVAAVLTNLALPWYPMF